PAIRRGRTPEVAPLRLRGRAVLRQSDGHLLPGDAAPPGDGGGDSPAPGVDLRRQFFRGGNWDVPAPPGARDPAHAGLPGRPPLHVRRVPDLLHLRRPRGACDRGDALAALPLRDSPWGP